MTSPVDAAEVGSPTFPALLQAVEQQSKESQTLFLRVRAAELACLALAATLSAVPPNSADPLAPFIAIAGFLGAIALRIAATGERAERRWYDARAAAESIKSLSWQFAVGGSSYPLGDVTAKARFTDALRQVLTTLKHLDVPPSSTSDLVVTQTMLTLREKSNQVRAATYGKHRVEDQVGWYAREARRNKVAARKWRTWLIGVEVAAVLCGALRVAGLIEIDLLGSLAAVGASLAAWQQVKDFTQLAEAYAVTSQEIAIVCNDIGSQSDEAAWANAVHDAEAAFSREHTLWLARRQGPIQPP